MIKCRHCNHTGIYSGPICPSCKKKLFSKTDVPMLRSLLSAAKRERDQEGIFKYTRILADLGITEYETELAKLLESPPLANLDLAEDYFLRAARKNDPEAAYGYARLVSRASNEVYFFWLAFSAVLGYEKAYLPLAEELYNEGSTEAAYYFYSLLADMGNTDAIVIMAKKYYEGKGTTVDYSFAKWYMDKLKIPPIYAISLAYKLRGVIGKEPPRLVFKNYDGFLRRLMHTAIDFGFDTAYAKLTSILAERGDGIAMTEHAQRLLKTPDEEGKEGENVKAALAFLNRAAALGNAGAHLALADIYIEGIYADKDPKKAEEHLLAAGAAKSADGPLILANMYFEGGFIKRDVLRAIMLYEEAMKLGSMQAKEMLLKINSQREKSFAAAKKAQSPAEAMRLYAMAADLGHLGAHLALADCFRYGIGTKINRRGTFLLYEKAAKFGEKQAYFPLGLCYAFGIGTKLNYEKAKEFFIKADRTGDERARAELVALMERKMKKASQRLYSTAMRLIHINKFGSARIYLEIATDVMHPKAIYTLGCFFEFGITVPCDKDRAFELYSTAKSLGYKDPREVYKKRLLKAAKRAANE